MKFYMTVLQGSVALALYAGATASHAAHPYITDDTGTQGAKNWQLELMFERDRNSAAVAGGTDTRSQSVFNPVLTYGLLDNLDIALGTTKLRQHSQSPSGVNDASGGGDSSLELKWRFYENGPLSLGFKPGLSLPTGDENQGLGTGKLGWAANFIVVYDAKPWTWLGNLAYVHQAFSLPAVAAANRANLTRVSAGFARALGEEMRLVGEVGMRTNSAIGDTALPEQTGRFAMLGMIYSPNAKTDYDLALRHALNRGEMDSALLAGATFRW